MKRRINFKMIQIRTKLVQIMADKRGEGFVDTAIKILMAVVIGALLLAGLYKLFADTVLPTLTRRVTEMCNYSG